MQTIGEGKAEFRGNVSERDTVMPDLKFQRVTRVTRVTRVWGIVDEKADVYIDSAGISISHCPGEPSRLHLKAR